MREIKYDILGKNNSMKSEKKTFIQGNTDNTLFFFFFFMDNKTHKN